MAHTNYMKSTYVVPLALIAAAGLTVRGFQELRTYGNGWTVKADSIQKDGVGVSDVAVNWGLGHGPITVSWRLAGVDGFVTLSLKVSDSGQMKIEPWAEESAEAPKEESWR